MQGEGDGTLPPVHARAPAHLTPPMAWPGKSIATICSADCFRRSVYMPPCTIPKRDWQQFRVSSFEFPETIFRETISAASDTFSLRSFVSGHDFSRADTSPKLAASNKVPGTS